MSVKDLAKPDEVQPSQKDLEGWAESSNRATIGRNNSEVMSKGGERKASDVSLKPLTGDQSTMGDFYGGGYSDNDAGSHVTNRRT